MFPESSASSAAAVIPFAIPFALVVFILQGTLMVVDEFHFHRRREVPRWERIGHPLDTLTVLVPLLLALWLPPAAPWTTLYFGLALFSCLFVTKDEWVHARHCDPAENWVHALLFILHPLLLIGIYLVWHAGETGLLTIQAVLAASFFAWQTFYWNGPWAPRTIRR